jgi:predicted DNA-binding ribbon-helix-helix protein
MRATNKRDGERIATPRTIFIGNHRTSIRLEAVMWDALADIADEHGKTVYDLIAEIHRNHSQANLSSAIRVYIVEHYRAALHMARSASETGPKVAPERMPGADLKRV